MMELPDTEKRFLDMAYGMCADKIAFMYGLAAAEVTYLYTTLTSKPSLLYVIDKNADEEDQGPANALITFINDITSATENLIDYMRLHASMNNTTDVLEFAFRAEGVDLSDDPSVDEAQ